MWINNSIVEKQIKETDSIPEGFVIGRLPRPKKIDTLVKLISKEDLIQYYIIENHSYIDTMNHFNLTIRKDLRLLLNEYGIAKDHKLSAKIAKRTRTHESYIEGGKKSSKTQKDNWALKSEEEKLKYSELQKVAHSTDSFKQSISKINIEYQKNLSKDIKDERNRKRSESCKKAWKNPDLIVKQKSTAEKNRMARKNNGQFCRTYDEQKIYDSLVDRGYSVIYDRVIDDRYPYYVDFYIKSLDLFIEYQGYPAHGNYPYIEGDKRSILEANRLYGGWREMYLTTDVVKYNKAIESNINFIRIYPNSSLDDNYNINNNKFKDIIELIYRTVHKK